MTYMEQMRTPCTRCRRDINKVWAILCQANRCMYCLHPILPLPALEASKALLRMDGRNEMIAALIAGEEAKAREGKP